MTTAYVSSTYIDLVVHRDAVMRALRKAQVEVIGMEDYIASDTRPVTKCLGDVSKADVYIGLFAHRYGYVPRDDNPQRMAVTEMEYRHAVQHGKVCLIFLHSEDDQWPPKFVDSGDGEAPKRVKALREELSQELLISFFTTADNLAALVVAAVRNYEESNKSTSDRGRENKVELSIPNIQRLRSFLQTRESVAEQMTDVIQHIGDMLQLALQLFVVTTVRSYETIIVDEPREYSKKVRPIKKILAEKFANPSLTTVYDLAEQCYHLVSADAPSELVSMKADLATDFTLGPIGDLIDTLESIFPPDVKKPRLVNRSALRRNLLAFVIPELCKYLAKLELQAGDADWENRVQESATALSLHALDALVARLTPILSQTFIVESLESVDSNDRKYTLVERSYKNHAVQLSRREVSFEELEHYEGDVPQIVTTRNGSAVRLNLSPFLVVKDDSLCFYRRTRSVGYEYYSVSHDRPYIERTKRKFSHTLLRQGIKGAEQALFFTDVIPTTNEATGVRSNIPSEGPVDFVGRRRQKAQIRKEILEIPNQNGIVYGVGGVGKTALMIQMSLELAQSADPLFSNIVWASAKTTYYNPTLDVVRERATSLESLDSILLTILYFFDFEDLDGYTVDDKKALLLELLHENQVLLILDNCETITKAERDEIIKFFEVDVKYRLRLQPNNFKVIITSRETIPCGFHPLSLTGLDMREAKQLMTSLYKQYSSGATELSVDQKEQLHSATFGIPIVIKHVFGRHYENHKSFSSVVESLPHVDSQKLVDFSYQEILAEIKKDRCALETLLLLELMNCPLMSRQIADILERNDDSIEAALPTLANYQCIGRVNEGPHEKYTINPEIRLLTKKLVLQHPELVKTIKHHATKNFTLEKQMDYTTEEIGILTLFDEYVRSGQYLEAERFINEELTKHPQSILLKFIYARYLKTERKQVERAIDILEGIRKSSHDHISVLRLLISCYTATDIPNYQRAAPYINEVEAVANGDNLLMLEVAEFYTRWSISKKRSKEVCPDPLNEIRRQQEYKELADRALRWLGHISPQSHHVLYLTAQCYFNKWEYASALRLLEKAIELCDPNEPCRSSYLYLERLVKKTKEWYEEEGWRKLPDPDESDSDWFKLRGKVNSW